MVWGFVSLPISNSYVQILIPKVPVLGGGVFGSWSGHEEGALMVGISAFIKEDKQGSLAFSTLWEGSERSAVYNPKEGLYQNPTWCWTSSLQNWEE